MWAKTAEKFDGSESNQPKHAFAFRCRIREVSLVIRIGKPYHKQRHVHTEKHWYQVCHAFSFFSRNVDIINILLIDMYFVLLCCFNTAMTPHKESSRISLTVSVVDGEWGPWQGWTECSQTCGGGTKNRTRLCNNPRPQYDGLDCNGDAVESFDCNTNGCPGKWRYVQGPF